MGLLTQLAVLRGLNKDDLLLALTPESTFGIMAHSAARSAETESDREGTAGLSGDFVPLVRPCTTVPTERTMLLERSRLSDNAVRVVEESKGILLPLTTVHLPDPNKVPWPKHIQVGLDIDVNNQITVIFSGPGGRPRIRYPVDDVHRRAPTNAGLEHLKGLTSMQELDLRGTQVSDAGAEELKKALPGVEVNWR